MPIGPGGERLPYPGDPGYMGNGPDMPMAGPPMGGPPPMGQPMEGPGGQAERLNQLLEARQMIDQEIAAIVGGPPGTENLDMLPPPPMDPMAQMPPQGPPNGMPMPGGPPMGQPMPPMGPQGLLGM
jgi:hypothetical protein